MNINSTISTIDICRGELTSLEERINGRLPDPSQLLPEKLAAALLGLRDVIPPWFIPLMENARRRFTQSSPAWEAFHDNLMDEVKERHDELLRQFIDQSDAPKFLLLDSVRQDVALIKERVEKELFPRFREYMEGEDIAPIVSLMTALEVTSNAPVQWIKTVGSEYLNNPDTTWADIHGPADAKHSEVLLQVFADLVDEGKIPMRRPDQPRSRERMTERVTWPFNTAYDMWDMTLCYMLPRERW